LWESLFFEQELFMISRPTRPRWAPVLVLSLLFAPAARAQSPRPMTIVDLIEVPAMRDVQIAPGGAKIAYALGRADWKQNQTVVHVWRVNADGSGAIQLTSGMKGESSPRWSPDGKRLAFIATRDSTKEAQLYVLGMEGGEGRRLTAHATDVSDIEWSPDGRFIYFVAPDDKAAEDKAREKERDDVYRYDENFQQRHLWRIPADSGAEERLTSGDYTVSSYELSRDGSKIVMHRAPDPLLGSTDRGEVWVTDATGRNGVQLTKNAVGESGARISPDNAQVLFTSGANANFETYYNDRLFLVPAAGCPHGGCAARMLLPAFAYEVQNAEWSKDGKSIYFVANMGVHSELFRVNVATGATEQLTDGQHGIRTWSYDPAADVHAIAFDEPTNPGDVWTLAGTKGARPKRVTQVFVNLGRQFRLPRQERITWKGADGTPVEGLLYYPLDYAPGTRYPLVVQTHGGPQSSDQFGFPTSSSYEAVLTARGYAVLQPNYRGSTGYGDEFMRDMVGHYFQNAHLDVLAGVDHLISIGVADSTRLVAMGWSAGGHMTNKLITATTRFKAASSGAGAANWVSMYAQSDIRSYRTPWFGGTPWQENAPIDVYWASSPLKDVAKVKTPTVFLVGERDPRVPMPQSVEMYRALKANGVPTRLYVAPREPHGWGELRHRLFKANAELDWFERYVFGREYVWEKVPGAAKASETATKD
jgi:dipeptidyl aminopeptidase/acylaminoacyl peptidase